MMKVQQRDIVHLNFELPGGKMKMHPALVISNENVLNTEEIFYAVMISTKTFNDEFTFELSNEMLSKPLLKKSFVKCQLIQSYQQIEVLSKISTLKPSFFKLVKDKIFNTVF